MRPPLSSMWNHSRMDLCFLKAVPWVHVSHQPRRRRVKQHAVNQMPVFGIQSDFVCVWDRHCQAVFVFPALSSRVSANKGATPDPASLDPALWCQEQGMETEAGDGAGSRGWSWEQTMDSESGDRDRSRGWSQEQGMRQKQGMQPGAGDGAGRRGSSQEQKMETGAGDGADSRQWSQSREQGMELGVGDGAGSRRWS